MIKILVVDDEPPILELVGKVLKKAGWENFELARNGEQALEKLRHGHFELCILDLQMPIMNGLEVIRKVREEEIQTEILVLTGKGTIENAVEAMKQGAKDFLTKPFQPAKLQEAVSKMAGKYQPIPHVMAERFDVFLEQNATDNSLRVEDLCKHFQRSPGYISRLLKTYIGVSFSRRLAFHRIERAKELIQKTHQPLYLISEQCGFGDYRRMYEAFCRLEGHSPKDFRKCGLESG